MDAAMGDKEARDTAVTDTDHDICLSAGAGSGKTTVLIARLIHLMVSGQADLRQVVAITFTEKAAAELKNRLLKALREQGKDRSRTFWPYEMSQARIGTIHGFCRTLFMENAVEAGMDPAFDVLDDVNGSALRRQTLDAWIDERLTEAGEGRGCLAPLLERLDLRRVQEMLSEVMEKPLKFATVMNLYGMGIPEESKEHRDIREALMTAAGDLASRWRAIQEEQGKVDFDGLIGRTRDLLRDSRETRARYQRRFRYVHIDEFQDVDGTQADLVRLLCGFGETVPDPPRLFVVGDPQQSIYRFRGADVDQFARMRGAILERGGKALALTRCFRSQARLVGFFNHTFGKVFHPALGLPEESRVSYTPIASVRTADPSAPSVEFVFLPITGKAGESREAEADALARRLREMIDHRERIVGERQADDTEVRREVRAGDIALLFRAMTQVRLYEQALRAYGIPYYTVAGSGFFERQEVLDALNVLQLMTRPHDRLALASVLRGPWVGISDTTLYWVAAEGAWDDLRDQDLRKKIDADEGACLDTFLSWFEDLREQRDCLPIADLLSAILDRTLYRAALTVRPDGPQALANLRKLLEMARQMDAGPGLSLHDFVAYLEERREETPREAESALELEEGDTIKLMSVHQAKGLEWPVVAVVDLNRGFRKPEGDLLYDPVAGIGMKLRDERFEMKAGPEYARVMETLTELGRMENQRMLYVAATRARDRLILSGSFNPGKLKPAIDGDHSWLQWVGAVYPVQAPAVTYPDDGHPSPIRLDMPSQIQTSPPGRGMAWPELTGAIRDLASQSEPAPEGWLARLTPPPPDGHPRRVAVTELELFGTCPRRYQLRRLIRLPEDTGPSPFSEAEGEGGDRTPAISVGALVHAALQQLPADAVREDLPGLVQSVIRGWGEETLPIGPDAEEAAGRLLVQWLKSERWKEVRESLERQHEVPFTLRMSDGHCLIGRFDLLYRDASERWRILDYKTDRLDGPAAAHVERYYALQQQAYGLAGARLLGEKFAGVTFTFLRSGEEVGWEPSPEAMSKAGTLVRDEIASWGGALRSETFPMTGDTIRCVRCGYRSLCGR